MEFNLVGVLFFIASCGIGYLLSRWLGRRRNDAKSQRERAATEAAQSRQVRRARQRQQRR